MLKKLEILSEFDVRFHTKLREFNLSCFTYCTKHRPASALIAILTVTSPVVINVPTRGLLAVETKGSFVLWLAKFKYEKTCL